jgi:DNA-binding MarR family transcriptional regulator
MSLEKEIYQQSFRSERHKAIVNIIYTFNWLRDRMQEQFTCHDLTMQQYNILRILRGANQPISTLQIRERMLDKMSDTSRIVDRLIVKELVEKNVCERDKRLVDVFITEKGKTLLKKMDGHAEQLDKLMDNISEEDAGHLNYLLDAIRQKTGDKIEQNTVPA